MQGNEKKGGRKEEMQKGRNENRKEGTHKNKEIKLNAQTHNPNTIRILNYSVFCSY